MTPRLRRLTADHQQVYAAFSAHSRIRLLGAEGNPPEKYTVEFQVQGLVPDAGPEGYRQGEAHRA